MLTIRYNPDGTRTTMLIKDWHPGRISLSYMPPQKNYTQFQHEYAVQTALLTSSKRVLSYP